MHTGARMMSTLDEIKKGSPSHQVRIMAGGAFQISPISDSPEDLERFQSIAETAIALAAAEGRYCLPHPINRHSLDGYDTIVIGEDNSAG
jgi:hypothetical protein